MIKAAIPARCTVENYITTHITNLFGNSFTGTHMVWGAINELTTLQGYRRLWQAAEHPLLAILLRAIVREESSHANFYWRIARLKLLRSKLARGLARSVVKRFRAPVGQGGKPQNETDYVIATLFSGLDGVRFFNKNVSQTIERLPGLSELRMVTGRITHISIGRGYLSIEDQHLIAA